MAGGGEGVGIEESTQCGVVVTGLAVVQLGFRVIHISTVAEGIAIRVLVVRDVEDISPGVVTVDAVGFAAGIDKTDNIALLIQNIVQLGAIVDHGIGLAVLIIGEVHDRGIADGQPYQLVTHVVIGVLHAVHDLLVPQAVGVVLVGNAGRFVCGGHQLPAVGPCEFPCGAVIVARRVADVLLCQPWNPKIPWLFQEIRVNSICNNTCSMNEPL